MSASNLAEAIQQAIDQTQPIIRIIMPRRMREATTSEPVAKSSASLPARR